MFRFITPACADWAPIAIRIPLGIIMFAHGAQKTFGWFDGHGLSETAGFMSQLGLVPPMFWAVVLALTELVGGILVLFGLAARFSAAAITISQLVAVWKVHGQHGFFLSAQGFEYNLALIGIGVALILSGSGKLSIDSLFAPRGRQTT